MINPFSNRLVISVLFLFVGVAVLVRCKKDGEDNQQSILQGQATIFVDESFQYLMEDQATVFESQYKAELSLVNKSESEIINTMLSGKADIAVLSRRLTKEEENYFTNKKITPKVRHFASDAIVFITGKQSKDTLIDLQQVINLMQGKQSTIKDLVFENPNSGTVSYMNRLANATKGENNKLYFLKSDKEVIEFIANNPESIGVIGLSPLVQPYPESKSSVAKITMMSVKNVKSGANVEQYFKPTQHNLGEGLYPLKRSIYMLNYQGFSGLGMGFASFVAGDIGQRIVRQSQLLPVRIPETNINIRTKIE